MSFEEANDTLNKLQTHATNGNIAGGKEALAKMKILMLEFPVGTEAAAAFKTIATAALEIGVLLSVADRDSVSFARNMAQLKSYYLTSTKETSDIVSTQKCHVLGLNLMYLLVENRLSEFHSELELLSSKESTSPYISFPVNMERQLMVGLYDEVLEAGTHIPDPSFALFMEHLIQTVRDSIADCLEVSYKTMKISDAAGMMKFTHVDEFLEYVQSCREDWILEDDCVFFQLPDVDCKSSDIPSMKLIEQSLSYATELERII